MRILSLGAATMGGALILLTACSGGSQGSSPVPPGSGTSMARHSLAELVKTGIAPKFFPLLRFHRVKNHPLTGVGPRHILVDDAGAADVAVIDNGDWSNDGTITSGIAGPDGNFVANHSFYEADYVNLEINEYTHVPGSDWIGSTPSFAYNSGISDPVDVAVDSNGNVYAANYNFGSGGAVIEYPQGSNTPIATCTVTGGAEGVAIDKAGDVFVSEVVSGAGEVVMFTGGLSGCSGTTLPLGSLGYLGGMATDGNNNLVVCEQDTATFGAGEVLVVAPPYTSVTGTLGSGYSAPFHVTINKRNKVAYVADDAAAVVDVLSYPSGSLITQLGSANGLVDPYSAVYGENAVY